MSEGVVDGLKDDWDVGHDVGIIVGIEDGVKVVGMQLGAEDG